MKMKLQNVQMQGWIHARSDTLKWYISLVSLIVLSLECVAAACTADGELDPTFGVNGKVISDFTGEAYAVALQSDGKIVVLGKSGDPASGRAPLLVRYQPDGTLDTTFGPSGTGTVLLDALACSALMIQADGKILVTGNIVMSPYSTTGEGATGAGVAPLHHFLDVVVLRYLPDGTPDLVFGQNGRVTTDLSNRSDDLATGIALQPDGNIVVAGFVDTEGDRDFAVVRYHSDGTLDQSFGTDGVIITNVGSRFDEAVAVAIQADGKILVAGTTYHEATHYDFAVVRYTPKGELDSTFGADGTGIVTTDIANADQAHAMALQPDGKIVVAGSSSLNRDFAVARYNPEGILDTTFGSDGSVITNFSGSTGGFGQSVTLQPDGKMIVAGYIYIVTENSDIAIAQYTSDGKLDETFGTDGKVTMDIQGKWDMGYAVTAEPDGKFIVTGSAYAGTDIHVIVVRYCGQRPMSYSGK